MNTSLIFEMAGTMGSLIMCVSAVPQIIKICRTKKAHDLSFGYLATLLSGLALIQVYAIHVRDFVFIFGNTLSILLTIILLALWFRYTRLKIIS